MSMTKRFAVSFDMKVVIPESDIQNLILQVSDVRIPTGTKNPNMSAAISSLRHAEAEECKRIYAEQLVEIAFREQIRASLKEELTSLLEGGVTMSNPKVSVLV